MVGWADVLDSDFRRRRAIDISSLDDMFDVTITFDITITVTMSSQDLTLIYGHVVKMGASNDMKQKWDTVKPVI